MLSLAEDRDGDGDAEVMVKDPTPRMSLSMLSGDNGGPVMPRCSRLEVVGEMKERSSLSLMSGCIDIQGDKSSNEGTGGYWGSRRGLRK